MTKKATIKSEGEKQRVCKHDSSHIQKKTIPVKKVTTPIIATMKARGKTKVTISWTKTAYKGYVKAYVYINGKKTYVRTSPLVHVYTSQGNKKYTNPAGISVAKEEVTLKEGKTSQIKATLKKADSSKLLMTDNHTTELRYVSTDKKVATVSADGKITAKSKGSCKVYVISINGVKKAVKVTVK